MWTMVITNRCSKQSHGCPWQGCRATNHTVTLRNLPNPASGTYTSARRNSPEPASGTYNSTRQNSPEPSGSCLRNLQKAHAGTLNLGEPSSGTYTSTHLSGTFRNLPPEPAPATRTGTHRSLSGLKTPLAYAVGEKVKKVHLFFGKSCCLLSSSRAARQGGEGDH